jgi:ribose-phosphate pyrophosphokinase
MQSPNKDFSESPFVLLTTPGMHDLGREIHDLIYKLGLIMPHYEVEVKKFKNGEVLPVVTHTVRRQHIFILHALQHPDPNEALISLFLLLDNIKRASATSITLVLPFMSYLRQDRKDKARVPISARAIANLIESNGLVNGLITIDMHAEQEAGFYDIPVDNLIGTRIFARHIIEKFGPDLSDLVMLAPDVGGGVRNNRLAKLIGELRTDAPGQDIPVSIGRKHRPGPNVSEILGIIGDSLEGKRVVIFEDMIDTGGTAIHTNKKIMEMGAKEVYLCGTHGIFSDNADERFSKANVQVATTDSIPRSADYYNANPWLTKVSLAPYFAEAIYESTIIGGSVSKLATADNCK